MKKTTQAGKTRKATKTARAKSATKVKKATAKVKKAAVKSGVKRKSAIGMPATTSAAPAVRPISFKGRSFDASSVLCDEGQRYPHGSEGKFAVCHYLPNEAKWVFHRTSTRESADARLRTLMKHPDVLKVVLNAGPHAGIQSAVVWVVRHDGQNWQTVMETTGAMQHLPN